MKRLTFIAALFLPISFVTGLFGMNLRQAPLWNDSLFWVFLVMIAAISAGQWFYFKRKGWVVTSGALVNPRARNTVAQPRLVRRTSIGGLRGTYDRPTASR
jgi:hypothetical protein